MKNKVQWFVKAVFFLGFLLPNVSSADKCNIQGVKFVREAIMHGYQFSIEKESGNGTCILNENKVSASAIASNDSNISCKIIFFGNRKLQDGWKFLEPKFISSTFEYISFPSMTNDPIFSVRLSSLKGEINNLLLSTIRLDGNECLSNWKEAL